MKAKFSRWEKEGDIGEASAYGHAARQLDMLVTPLESGGVEADLIDGANVIWRQWMPTVAAAKEAVETAAERRF